MLDTIQVTPVRDRRRIASTLGRDPVGAAYLLADLEDTYFEHTRWYVASREGSEIRSVLMVYTALQTPALLTFGDKEGIEKIAMERGGELPDRCMGMIWPGHETVLEKIYCTETRRRMIRMGLEREAFQPSRMGIDAVPLNLQDLPDLMKLMEHYPGNYFEKAMFREGRYYGIRLEDALVSAAGIHTCSPTYGAAALGNIVTHSRHRRRGLASACTSALVASLIDRIRWIALNVEAANTAAIRCYRRLGFAEHLHYQEGVYRKKEHP